MIKNLYLKEPSIDDKSEILEIIEELKTCGDEYPFDGARLYKDVTDTNYDIFLKKIENNKIINSVNSDWANQNSYVLADENGHIYGGCSLRHTLCGNLINVGGHISYFIRPSERKKGYGKYQLELVLKEAKKLGITEALITCRENNIASKKTMTSFKGRADTLTSSQYPGIKEYRYWIDNK